MNLNSSGILFAGVLLSSSLLSSLGAALPLPSSVQTLRQSAFCKKYLCVATPDASVFALSGKALERLDYLSEVTLETLFEKGKQGKNGKLTRLMLNMQSSIPGDGATPSELEAAFKQLNTLKAEFSTAFLPRSVALELVGRCNYARGHSFTSRFVEKGQSFKVNCEFFSVTLEAL